MNATTASPVRIDHDELVLGPVTVRFMRTLRIPEDGLSSLPPGLGTFPLRRVADYPDTAPPEWLAQGGVMLPMYQREALWLDFGADEPAALQVGIGKVSAISGEAWSETLQRTPQDYVTLPEQPWLDGINAGDGLIRQFVAVPMGSGATVEAEVTGAETVGGIQLRAVGLTREALEKYERDINRRAMAFHLNEALLGAVACMAAPPDPSMGLGAGGRMRQEIYEDDRPASNYDESRCWRVFVHLCSAAQWAAITGELPPRSPVDRDEYTRAGLPWFDYFDKDERDLPAPESLVRVRPVGEILGLPDDGVVAAPPGQVVQLKDARGVVDGVW